MFKSVDSYKRQHVNKIKMSAFIARKGYWWFSGSSETFRKFCCICFFCWSRLCSNSSSWAISCLRVDNLPVTSPDEQLGPAPLSSKHNNQKIMYGTQYRYWYSHVQRVIFYDIHHTILCHAKLRILEFLSAYNGRNTFYNCPTNDHGKSLRALVTPVIAFIRIVSYLIIVANTQKIHFISPTTRYE